MDLIFKTNNSGSRVSVANGLYEIFFRPVTTPITKLRIGVLHIYKNRNFHHIRKLGSV